jgi:uncharacterized peroxidase-related enzyme
MTRLDALNPANATGKVHEMFTAIEGKLGMVPNMMRTMGNSSAVLNGYLSLSGALGAGALGAKTGELIAMTVAQANSCNYCLSAHAFIGENLLKMNPATLQDARNARSGDAKTAAALRFAEVLVQKRGLVDNEDVAAAKSAGLSQGEIAEVVAHVALNVFTNYLNNTALTEVDFPLVEARAVAVI